MSKSNSVAKKSKINKKKGIKLLTTSDEADKIQIKNEAGLTKAMSDDSLCSDVELDNPSNWSLDKRSKGIIETGGSHSFGHKLVFKKNKKAEKNSSSSELDDQIGFKKLSIRNHGSMEASSSDTNVQDAKEKFEAKEVASDTDTDNRDEKRFLQQKDFDLILAELNSVKNEIKAVKSEFSSFKQIDRITQLQSKINNIEAFVQTKEYNAAITAYNNIIKNLNDGLDDEEILFTCIFNRATFYRALRKYVDALSDYDSLIQNPRLKHYYHVILSKKNDAECELVQEMVDETIQNCQTCNSWKKNDPTIIDDMHKSLLNKNELKTKEYDRLSCIAWKEHAQFHYNNQDFQTSLKIALEALQKYPKQSKLYYIAAESCYKLRQFEQAKVYYQTAQSIKPDKKAEFKQKIYLCDFEIWMMEMQTLLNTVDKYWEQGQYDEARIQLNKIGSPEKLIIELRQRFLFYSARDLFQRKMLPEAYDSCNEILHVNEQHLDARLLRAQINFAMKKYEEAVQDYDRVPGNCIHGTDEETIQLLRRIT